MKLRRHEGPSARPAAERGVALVMALMFLVVLTILGITAIGSTTLEERMANNTRDRNTAFQAAETALVTGETWVFAQIDEPIFPDVANGMYLPGSCASEPEKPNWECPDLDWSSTSNLVVYPNVPKQTNPGGLTHVTSQPRYIIEDMGQINESGGSVATRSAYQNIGNTLKAFRVTARGTGRSDAARVMVQSVYTRPF